ncbi:hypothetical protein BYT27DRAFT_7079465 [Phlegmacium glaucopus]|nr:hypothetical protein BYT27DRAFT_7079465 [Phlegmacium glaucopus]
MVVSDVDEEFGGGESDADWFEEAIKKEDKLESVRRETSVFEEFRDTSGESFITVESVQTIGTAELYNSGCTNHISPYRDQFNNFEEITPRHFCAANKQTFSMIGKGELVINIPNGNNTLQL